MLCAEPKEYRRFRPGTRPGGVGFPAGRIGDRSDREIVYVPNVYVPFPAPTLFLSVPRGCFQDHKGPPLSTLVDANRRWAIAPNLGGRFGYLYFFCSGEGKGGVEAPGGGGGATLY